MRGKHVRIALVGAGGIGKRWARALRESGQFRVAAVVDTDLKKAGALAEQFSSCEAIANWKSVMKRSDIDAVLVATPHVLLAPIARAAFQAGKHVLCEKPGAIRSQDIKKNIVLAKQKKRVYMIGFNHRFHPGFVLARKLWLQGKIGDIQFIRARYGFGGRPEMQKEWRFDKKIAGGGELIDQGVHMIDMARSFLGEFTDVVGFADPLFWKAKVEDNAFVLLRTKKKQVASIHVSWSNWKPIHEFEMYGTTGYLLVQGLGRKYGGTEKLIWGKRSRNFVDAPVEKEFVCNPDADQSLIAELKEFATAIVSHRDPVPNGRDAYEVLKIVEQVYI